MAKTIVVPPQNTGPVILIKQQIRDLFPRARYSGYSRTFILGTEDFKSFSALKCQIYGNFTVVEA